MEKFESIVAIAIVILIILVFFFINLTNDDDVNLINNSIERSDMVEDVTGSYEVKNDKNSRLLLNDDGTYNFNLNICEGYLELKGVYEVRDRNLYLINRTSYEEYTNLFNNEEFHFTILDDNSIRLEEDLVCLYRETLFEK